MSTKRKPCTNTTGRHSWQFVKNVVLRGESINSISLRHVGAYRCQHCKAVKQGEARRGDEAVTFNELHGIGAGA